MWSIATYLNGFTDSLQITATLSRLYADHGLLVRYMKLKLRVAHAPGMPGTFPPPPRLAIPTCITASRRGKRSRHSPHMRNPQVYVFGKRSIAHALKRGVSACGVLSCNMSMNTENASKMEIPRDNFSPESTGTTKIRADRAAKTIAGIMMFTK